MTREPRVRELLRPEPDEEVLRRIPQRGAHLAGKLEPVGPERDAVRVEPAADEVHRRAADEARDERVLRTLVEALRRVDLLHDAVAQHDHALPERHRLRLVVRDVDRRDAEPAVQLRELPAHLHAQLRVEVRKRLVHEEDLRVPDDRAPHRNALALPARELARLARQ